MNGVGPARPRQRRCARAGPIVGKTNFGTPRKATSRNAFQTTQKAHRSGYPGRLAAALSPVSPKARSARPADVCTPMGRRPDRPHRVGPSTVPRRPYRGSRVPPWVLPDALACGCSRRRGPSSGGGRPIVAPYRDARTRGLAWVSSWAQWIAQAGKSMASSNRTRVGMPRKLPKFLPGDNAHPG